MTRHTLRGTSAILSIATFAAAIFLTGCKQGTLVLEEGRWTVDADAEPNLILYVGSVFPQRLDIRIDDILAVSQRIRSPVRHGHRRHEKFLFLLPKGLHRLEIESPTSGAKAEREIEIEEKLWAVISSGANGFSIIVSDSPIGFL
jgi:hypothetical protein